MPVTNHDGNIIEVEIQFIRCPTLFRKKPLVTLNTQPLTSRNDTTASLEEKLATQPRNSPKTALDMQKRKTQYGHWEGYYCKK